MNDFQSEPKALQQSMLSAVERVMGSGRYILGDEVKNFERLWADRCGVPFGIGVGNGLQAIEMALRAVNIGTGDEVITSSMSAFATLLAIVRVGATPVLADIEPDTALLSIESAQRCLSPKTRAVLLVHLYGQLDAMDQWVKWCNQQGIFLIEDCAQAHLSSWDGRAAGAFGQVGAYSFYPTKNLGALGDAGMLVTNDATLADRARCLRNYGQSHPGVHPELGTNSRLDEIHAAILTERLQWLTEFTKKRREIAQNYRTHITHPLVKLLRPPLQPSAHSCHLFVVTCEARVALQRHLHQHGIQTSIHYRMPIHKQKPCQEMRCDPRGLLNTERHAHTCLSLPCHPQMQDSAVDAVVTAVNAF